MSLHYSSRTRRCRTPGCSSRCLLFSRKSTRVRGLLGFLLQNLILPLFGPDLRHPIVTGLIHLHAALLLPLFNSLWLRQGTGNANFFYASTLVFGMGNGAALLDAVWAGLRIAIGQLDEGYEVVQE